MAGNQEGYLSNAHLRALLMVAEPAINKWYEFGEALEIDKRTLDGFRSNNMDNYTELTLVLSHYLNGTNPTTGRVVTALRSVGCDTGATDLEKYATIGDYGTDMSHAQQSVSVVQKIPQCPTGLKPCVVGKVRSPRGLAVRGDDIYVADKGLDSREACVKVIRPGRGDNIITTLIPRDPYGIALDEDGNVYATDCRYHRLYKFDKLLVYLKKAGTGSQGRRDEEFCYPHGVGVIRGMVYVCDNGSCRVKVYDRDLNFKYSFGDRKGERFEEQTLFGPVDVVSDSMGGLYVSDNKKMGVVKFRLRESGPPDFVRNIGDNCLKMPCGLTVDSNDYVYVTDKLRNRIVVFNPTGSLVTELATDPMMAPRAISCRRGPTGSSTLYVSDTNNEVNMWQCDIEYS